MLDLSLASVSRSLLPRSLGPCWSLALVSLLACRNSPEAGEETGGGTASEVSEMPSPAKEEAPRPEKPLAIGDTVYDFQALTHLGRRVRLSDFLDRPVLVYFCPADADPACEALSGAIRDSWLALQPQLGMVLGVTSDSSVRHRAFSTREKLPQLLVPDKRGRLRETFGLPVGAFVSYLVSTERKVLQVFSPPQTAQHPAEVVKALQEQGLLRPAYPM